MFRPCVNFVTLFVILAMGTAPVCAQPILVGCTASINSTLANAGRLVDLDLSTGMASNSRPTGLRAMAGIAVQPGTGTLFGLTTEGSIDPANSLVTIDIATGNYTLIAPTGLTGIVEGDLAFNPVNGWLYGVQSVGTSGSQRNLFLMNPSNGSATVVGDLGPTAGTAADISALAFTASGTLLAIDSSGTDFSRLLTLDPTTGQVMFSATMNVNLGSAVGMTCHPVTGVAYVGDNISIVSGGTNSLYTLDPMTGQLTLIGPTGDPNGIGGLAFVSVPEPSSLALVLAVMGASAAFRSSRRSTPTQTRHRRPPCRFLRCC